MDEILDIHNYRNFGDLLSCWSFLKSKEFPVDTANLLKKPVRVKNEF